MLDPAREPASILGPRINLIWNFVGLKDEFDLEICDVFFAVFFFQAVRPSANNKSLSLFQAAFFTKTQLSSVCRKFRPQSRLMLPHLHMRCPLWSLHTPSSGSVNPLATPRYQQPPNIKQTLGPIFDIQIEATSRFYLGGRSTPLLVPAFQPMYRPPSLRGLEGEGAPLSLYQLGLATLAFHNLRGIRSQRGAGWFGAAGRRPCRRGSRMSRVAVGWGGLLVPDGSGEAAGNGGTDGSVPLGPSSMWPTTPSATSPTSPRASSGWTPPATPSLTCGGWLGFQVHDALQVGVGGKKK